MFLKQLILAAFQVLHAASRPLLEAYTCKHSLPQRHEPGRASQCIARFSRGMESFEVIAARTASGA